MSNFRITHDFIASSADSPVMFLPKTKYLSLEFVVSFTSLVLIMAIALYIPVSIGARMAAGIVITIFPSDVSTEKSEYKNSSEIPV